jgi:dTMP kinase
MFITFEGGEGSGKTTQVRRLADSLLRVGVPVVTLREPGGTVIGEEVRRLLFERGDLAAETQSFLFNAARSELVRKVILPALSENKVVICDRYVDSSVVIQGQAMPVAHVRSLCGVATDGLVPDITFYLDIDPELGLARRVAAGSVNHFDELYAVHGEAQRRAYYDLMLIEPERWRCVPAAGDVDAIAAHILRTVLADYRLPLYVDLREMEAEN